MREKETERKPEFAESDRCGRFGAFRFTAVVLCPGRYESCGSCCAEFNAEDEE